MANYVPVYTSTGYVQSKTGLSNAEYDLSSDTNVRMTIEDAEAELEELCGRKFTSANTYTDVFSIQDKDVIGNYSSKVTLTHYPVQSITLFQVLNSDATVNKSYAALDSASIAAGTYNTTDYWLDIQNDPLTNTQIPYGKISMASDTFPKGNNNVKVTYTYGYPTVPVPVRNLATCMAAIRVWVAFLGGSYNRLNSYSIPQQSVDKGDFYQRGMQNIQLLTDEANRLLDRTGRKPRTLIFSTGGDR